MSDLTEFAASIHAVWLSEGRSGQEPLGVGELLDRVFPYSLARRRLGIDVSEDYEALVVRLLSEEGAVVKIMPEEAGELARATMSEKLPDLSVLQLLRGATLLFRVDPPRVVPVEPVAPPPPAPPEQPDTRWRDASTPSEVAPVPDMPEATPLPPCWNCDADLPMGRSVKFCPHCGADQRAPVCRHCQEPLERGWKHCPECGQPKRLVDEVRKHIEWERRQ